MNTEKFYNIFFALGGIVIAFIYLFLFIWFLKRRAHKIKFIISQEKSVIIDDKLKTYGWIIFILTLPTWFLITSDILNDQPFLLDVVASIDLLLTYVAIRFWLASIKTKE